MMRREGVLDLPIHQHNFIVEKGVRFISIHQYKNVVKKRVYSYLSPTLPTILTSVKIRLLSLHSSIINPLSLLQKEG